MTESIGRDLSNKATLTKAEMTKRYSSEESRKTKLPHGYIFSNITPLGHAPQRWVIREAPKGYYR